MQQAGFEVERIIRFNRVSRPAWFVSRLVWLWRRADGLLPWKPTSIIAIARKP